MVGYILYCPATHTLPCTSMFMVGYILYCPSTPTYFPLPSHTQSCISLFMVRYVLYCPATHTLPCSSLFMVGYILYCPATHTHPCTSMFMVGIYYTVLPLLPTSRSPPTPNPAPACLWLVYIILSCHPYPLPAPLPHSILHQPVYDEVCIILSYQHVCSWNKIMVSVNHHREKGSSSQLGSIFITVSCIYWYGYSI